MNYNIEDFEILETWTEGTCHHYQVGVSEDRSVIVWFEEVKSDSFIKNHVFSRLEAEARSWAEYEEALQLEQEQLAAAETQQME